MTLAQIEAEIERVAAENPSAGSLNAKGQEDLSVTSTSSDLQMRLKGVMGIRWPAIMITFVLLAVVAVALCYIVTVPAGVAFMVVNAVAHLLAVVMTVATLSTPRPPRSDRRPVIRRLLKTTDVVICLSAPVVVVLIVMFIVAAEATTNLEVISVLVGTALELALIARVFRIITSDPSWKLVGWQRLKQQVQQQEQWNREHAALLSAQTSPR